MTDRYASLDHARRHVRSWLDSLATRPAQPQAPVAEVTKALGTELPDGPTPAGRRGSVRGAGDPEPGQPG